MGKFVELHSAPPVNDFDVKIGDKFLIIHEDEHVIAIKVGEHVLGFTQTPDSEGNSYATWFKKI